MGERHGFSGLPLSDAEAAIAAEVDSAFLIEVVDTAPQLLEGDRALFSRLYVQHKSSLTYLCRRYLNDQRDVEEVVQETFLKLFLALPELESESSVVAWSRRTATNLCIDRYRADKRRPTMADLEVLPEEYGAECDEDYLVLAEDAAIVRDALADLPPLYRRALIAREIEELPLDVIAAQLDVEPAQMKHLLHRARRAMRRALESRTGRAVAGLMAALLAIGSLATGVRFLGGDRARNAGHIDANPLIDHSVDSLPPRVAQAPDAKPAPEVQTRKPVVATPRKPAVVQKPTAHTHKPVVQAPTPVAPPAKPPAVIPPATPPVAPPVVIPPKPPTYAVPAGPAFQVEGGVTQSGVAQLIDRGTASTSAGTSSLSTFSAATSDGALVIDQAVTQHENPNVQLQSVSLGGVTYSLGQVVVERQEQGDGSVIVTIFASTDQPRPTDAGTETVAVADVGALTLTSYTRFRPDTGDLLSGPPGAFTVSMVIAPGGVVLYERVAVAQA